MARIRTIKPGFFRSYDVTPLSYRARLTWIGLWTYVDDEGRGRDDARIIKGELWALEDEVTWQEVEKDLTELSVKGHVVRYEVSGKLYLCIPTWFDHQVISRPSKSRFPSVNEGVIWDSPRFSEDSVSAPGVDTAGKGRGKGNGSRNREEEPAPAALTSIHSDVLEGFDAFWNIWPRSEGKAEARKAWAKAVRKADPDTIVDAANAYNSHPDRPAAQYVPHGSTWLNGERWNDGPPTASEQGRAKPTPEQRARQTLALATDLLDDPKGITA